MPTPVVPVVVAFNEIVGDLEGGKGGGTRVAKMGGAAGGGGDLFLFSCGCHAPFPSFLLLPLIFFRLFSGTCENGPSSKDFFLVSSLGTSKE